MSTLYPRTPRVKPDRRFHDLLRAVAAKYEEKRVEKCPPDGDAFANMHAAKQWDVRPWVSAGMNAAEGLMRLQQHACRGHLSPEQVDDAFIDAATHILMGRILYAEENDG